MTFNKSFQTRGTRQLFMARGYHYYGGLKVKKKFKKKKLKKGKNVYFRGTIITLGTLLFCLKLIIKIDVFLYAARTVNCSIYLAQLLIV